MSAVICDYCQQPAVLVGGEAVYSFRPDLAKKNFWRCFACSAYVGCHGNTVIPLGRLANAELRKAKQAAHAAFDPLWKDGKMQRREAYRWLSDALGIPGKQTHIGMFDVDQCKAVVAAVKATP